MRVAAAGNACFSIQGGSRGGEFRPPDAAITTADLSMRKSETRNSSEREPFDARLTESQRKRRKRSVQSLAFVNEILINGLRIHDDTGGSTVGNVPAARRDHFPENVRGGRIVHPSRTRVMPHGVANDVFSGIESARRNMVGMCRRVRGNCSVHMA